MGNIIRFAETRAKLGLERVRSTYTVKQISRQFGLPPRFVRRWTQEGLIHSAPSSESPEPVFDLRGLGQFRRIRDLRAQGLTIRQIEAELRGQLNLFPPQEGRLIPLPIRLSPFEEALLLHERGDPAARDFYLKAVEEADSAADAFCNLGIMEFEAGNLPGAFNRLTQALKCDPRHFESHFNLAHIYFESGDFRLARLHYELAAEIEPSFADLYFNLGLLHALNNDLDQAAGALRRAKELSPEDEASRVEELLAQVENVAHTARDPE